MPLTVLLVDDHKVVREGYRRLIEGDAGLSIVGEASDADSAYRAFCDTNPDVVILDIAMPGASGVDAIHRMLVRDGSARIVVCSMYEDAIYVERSLDNGACGYVTKAAAAEVLVAAIKAVSAGERYVSPDAAAALARWQARGRDALASLNSREIEVLRLIVRGASIAEAASTMKLSEKTVANYQTLIRQKLGARNAAQLVHAAARYGIREQDQAGPRMMSMSDERGFSALHPATVRIDASRIPLQPWQNGGGSTRQLFAWPTTEDWIFRISLANVEKTGPFSSFPGIDRHIAIVEGSGISLTFEGGRRIVTLTQTPFHFDGALAPMCHVEAGPATDFNLMVDRLRGVGFLSRAAGEPWTSAFEWQGVFNADLCQISIGDEARVDLEPMTLLMTRGMAGVAWKFDGADSKSRAWWIAVSPDKSI